MKSSPKKSKIPPRTVQTIEIAKCQPKYGNNVQLKTINAVPITILSTSSESFLTSKLGCTKRTHKLRINGKIDNF